ncbi:MAG: hypothetical protein IJ862_07455 [Selenomonadaceae bacterium]|nr:hypothetical protein [Selenomonadaceae bacterium]
MNNFGWKYFNTLNKDENIFYSPYSIATALTIVANGAEKQTQEEMLKTLSISSLEDVNLSYKQFRNHVEKSYRDDGRNLLDSNLILINSKYAANGINSNYKKIVEDTYKSTVRQADFEGNLEGEKQKITKWVSDKTKYFIPNYKSIVTSDTIMDILNVIYFKGDWAKPFKSKYTKSEPFTNKDTSKVNVEMMYRTFDDELKYYENDKYKAIALPYKSLNGNNVAMMYLLLPIESSDVNIADKWNNESMEYKYKFMESIRQTPTFYGKVCVKLPKFELDIENLIVKNLKSMGIKRAFTNNAEFFNMVNDMSLKIGNVNHRAKIKVEETGTEAAAITEVVMLETTAVADPMPKVIKYFYANIPFLFVIEDVESNVELFTGVVNKM